MSIIKFIKNFDIENNDINDLYPIIAKIINYKIKNIERTFNVKISLPRLDKKKFFYDLDNIKNTEAIKINSDNEIIINLNNNNHTMSDELYNLDFDKAFSNQDKHLDQYVNKSSNIDDLSKKQNQNQIVNIMIDKFYDYLKNLIEIREQLIKLKNNEIYITDITNPYIIFESQEPVNIIIS